MTLTACVLGEAGDGLVAGEPSVAVELGRDHLEPGARDADTDLAVGLRQGLEQAGRIRSAGRTGYAEEDAHMRKRIGAAAGRYFPPREASRNVAIDSICAGVN